MFVTRISRYIYRSVLSVVSRNRGRSWNVLPVDTGALLYYYCLLRETVKINEVLIAWCLLYVKVRALWMNDSVWPTEVFVELFPSQKTCLTKWNEVVCQ
jgi:hypothetical protein